MQRHGSMDMQWKQRLKQRSEELSTRIAYRESFRTIPRHEKSSDEARRSGGTLKGQSTEQARWVVAEDSVQREEGAYQAKE
jgi:hypothetical protein